MSYGPNGGDVGSPSECQQKCDALNIEVLVGMEYGEGKARGGTDSCRCLVNAGYLSSIYKGEGNCPSNANLCSLRFRGGVGVVKGSSKKVQFADGLVCYKDRDFVFDPVRMNKNQRTSLSFGKTLTIGNSLFLCTMLTMLMQPTSKPSRSPSKLPTEKSTGSFFFIGSGSCADANEHRYDYVEYRVESLTDCKTKCYSLAVGQHLIECKKCYDFAVGRIGQLVGMNHAARTDGSDQCFCLMEDGGNTCPASATCQFGNSGSGEVLSLAMENDLDVITECYGWVTGPQ